MKKEEKAVENVKESEVVSDGISNDLSVDTKAMAKYLDIDEKYIIDDLHMTNLEKEKNPYLKSDLSNEKTIYKGDGTSRIDDVKSGESVSIADGTITGNEDGTVHVKSDYLGEFDYNPEEFRYGYKEVREADGSVGQLPVLEWITNDDGEINHLGLIENRNSSITIPDGIKSCDYMFANNENITLLPKLPDSVESAHGMFQNCPELLYGSRDINEGENICNVGGHVKFPEGLKDMSSMFKNSGKMKVDFGELPKSVLNVQDAWEGCEGMNGSDYYVDIGPLKLFEYKYTIPEYGNDITPYLTSTYAKNAMNDISNESVKKAADEAEYIVDEDGTIRADKKDLLENEELGIDKETLADAQAATGLKYQENIQKGLTSSEVEIASGGARSDNKVFNAATGQYEYDQTGELVSDDKSHSWWQHLVVDGGAGLLIGGVAGGLTGSKMVGLVVGVGGAVALDVMDILPESLSPILSGTANMLPEGGIKDKLNEWSKNLAGSTVDAQKSELTPEAVANEHQELRLGDSIKAANSVTIQDISESMYNNGRVVSTSMALWATAKRGESSAKTVNDYVVSKCTSAMESNWTSEIEKNGVTDEIKTDMKSYYTKMFEALDSYNQGAKDGIDSAFGKDSTKAQLSQKGLEMVNRSYTEGLMDSFVKMNDQYDFMSQSELKALQSDLQIDGIGDLTKYKDSNSFSELKMDAELEVDTLASMDALEEDSYSPDYGVSEDSVHYDAASARASKALPKSEKTNVEKTAKSSELTKETTSVESAKSKTDRGKQAEERFQDVLNADAKNAEELAYE